MAVYWYDIFYSWPDLQYRNGHLYSETASSGLTAQFAEPVTEEAWPTIAKQIETLRAIGPVTITSVRPVDEPK